jgi:hypothetical protein
LEASGGNDFKATLNNKPHLKFNFVAGFYDIRDGI